MKPIVEGMGMNWSAQFNKLKQRFASTIAEIAMVAEDGKTRMMTCLLLRKLTGWLYSISANKVRPDCRGLVVTFQNECDDVLWDHRNKTGPAPSETPSGKTTTNTRTPVRDAVNPLVGRKHLLYPVAYSFVHQ